MPELIIFGAKQCKASGHKSSSVDYMAADTTQA